MLATKLIGDDFEADTPFAQLKSFRMHNVASLPTLPDTARGQVKYLTSDDFLYLWRGTSLGWEQLTLASGDYASETYVDAGDAATYANAQAYANAISQGFDAKASVRVATAAALSANTHSGNNLTVNAAEGPITVDGIALAEGDELLVKDEVASEKNGIYAVNVEGDGGTPWVLTRRGDADNNSKVTSGMFCWVSEGTVNADTAWFLSTNDPIDVNTTGLTFSKFASLGSIPRSSIEAGTASHLLINNGSGLVSSEATLGATRFPALTGDITTPGGSLATTIGANKVLYSMLQDVTATQRILGRNTAGAGDPEEVTIAQLLAWIGSLPVTLERLVMTQSPLTYAATTDIDFDLADVRTITLTGNVTFTTSNKGAGKTKTLIITCDGTGRNFTFPAWIPLTVALPASIAANKVAVLTLTCTGTTDGSIVAGYAVQP